MDREREREEEVILCRVVVLSVFFLGLYYNNHLNIVLFFVC